jgi:hypothetical protein
LKTGCGTNVALQRIYWLQSGLRKALEQSRLVPLNRRDPMVPLVSFDKIERDIIEIENLVSSIETFAVG